MIQTDDFIKIYKSSSISLINSNPFLKSALIHLLFIRIHPFPDSNGRTSRAILNALTLDRNILVSFTKEELFSKAEELEKAGERITDITANPSILKEFYRKKRQQRG